MSIWNINAFIVDTLWSNNLIHLTIKDVEEFRQLPMDFLFNNDHLHEIYISRCYKFQGFLL
ncbi:hypothetical protein Syun_030543 [Stephania yunnanensis]|uniref:Uncharacterized protein n=1 Tax=Stephania yunnanensis TaxID=152371 RepID=A0AAP0HFP2_9MAGN